MLLLLAHRWFVAKQHSYLYLEQCINKTDINQLCLHVHLYTTVTAIEQTAIACRNSHFSSLVAAGDVSQGGTSVTQQQKFYTDDKKSVQNPERSAELVDRVVTLF